jgi:hypothetical protein
VADEDIITELVEFGASKVSGVRTPANGTEWLLMKAAEEPPKADPENPHKTSPEADAAEEKMTKAEADEIEALLTKSGIWSSYCGVDSCSVCEERLQATFSPSQLGKARLKAKQRAALPKSAFGVPSKAPGPGSFPMPDKGHAEAAMREIEHADPSERKGIRAKAARDFGVGKKDSPGVPNGDAHPVEGGHLDSGRSGLAGPMTGRTLDYDSTAEVKTDWPGGKVTYEIPVEAMANSIGPHGGPHMRKDFEIPLAKANWKELGRGELPGKGDQVVGSPAWERADAATLDSVARGLAAAAEQVRTIQGREVDEAMAGDAGDWGDAMKLSCAADDICNALGVVAAMAYHEAAEGNVTKSATTERLFEIFGGRPFTPAVNGAETSEEGSSMPTATKEELDAYVGEQIQKGVALQVKKIEKSSIKPLVKSVKALNKKLDTLVAAKESAVEAGAVSTGDLTGAVHGTHDAEDIDAIDGAHTDKPGVTKEVKVKGPKGTKALVKALQVNNDLLSKQLARPRSGGPVTDGQPRTGMIPALEGRQFETVAKDTEVAQIEADVVRLRKEIAEGIGDPAMREAKGRELTLAQLKVAHMTGSVPIGQF